jgi:anti-anti-sigma factor
MLVERAEDIRHCALLARLASRPRSRYAVMTGTSARRTTVAIVRRDGSVDADRAVRARYAAPGRDPLINTAALARCFDTLRSVTFVAAGARSGGGIEGWPAATMSADEPEQDIVTIEREDRGETHIVTLRGELDVAGAEKVTDALVAIAGSAVVVNLEHLTFLDAAGLSALLSAQRQVEHQGHQLSILGAQGIVRRVFDVTGLDHLLGD